MVGPLAGIRVVELGVWVAGPAAGCILADWGASVTKIEPPGIGDPARSFSRMLGGDLPFNPPFEMDNRGKRSIVLDLSTQEGRERALGHSREEGIRQPRGALPRTREPGDPRTTPALDLRDIIRRRLAARAQLLEQAGGIASREAHATSSSTSPQACAVVASIRSPVRAIHAVR